MLLASTEDSACNNSMWLNTVKISLDRLGMGGSDTGAIHEKAFERMKDTFYQEAFLDKNWPDSKLRTL